MAEGTILVADDGKMMRTLLARKLRETGYTIAEAADGNEALARIAEGGIDLVILDVVMPELGGMETLEQLRRTFSQTQLPIIMATANDEDQEIVRAFEMGANDYVTKPINFPVLLARIETQLRLKRAIEALGQEVERRIRAERAQGEGA